MLVEHYKGYDGELRYRAKVESVERQGDRVRGVQLAGGDFISCDTLLSTVGVPGTAALVDWPPQADKYEGRMSLLNQSPCCPWPARRTWLRITP